MTTDKETDEAATVRQSPGKGDDEESSGGDSETQTSGQVDALYGKEFAGRYHVGETLGKGGYGRVYRAKEIELERDVALKVLRSKREGYSERIRKRFLREAKLVAGLQEPHTIKLYDYGEADGYLYLAFEYVDGETLGEFVSSNGPLKPLTLAKLLEQILDSLHEAHEQGVLHRDIKPGNLMVYEHERRGLEVKVLDFGIGKMLEREDRQVAELTAEGTMMGTPRYMSPEQMRGDELGPPTDLWSLGVVALETLIGERVVKSSKPMQVTSCILEPGPEPFRVPPTVDVPSFFRQLVEKLLQKSVTDRYQTTSEVLEDLAELRQRERPAAGERGAEFTEPRNGEDVAVRETTVERAQEGSFGRRDGEPVDRCETESEGVRTARIEETSKETAEDTPTENNRLPLAHLVFGVTMLALGGLGVWLFDGATTGGGAEKAERKANEAASRVEAEGTNAVAPVELRGEQEDTGRPEKEVREEMKKTAKMAAEGVIASGAATSRAFEEKRAAQNADPGEARGREVESKRVEGRANQPSRQNGSKPEETSEGAPNDGAEREAEKASSEGKESTEDGTNQERLKVWGVE